jgi:3-hydroxyisobutyrate dehydrogenase-like beta-hydroxyacid dehydrogenase
MTAPVIGVVGLGSMGSRFARRFSSAGYEVHVYNRTRDRAAALEDLGVQVRKSPRELAERSDVVISMVWDSEALTQVMTGSDGVLGGLGPGKIVADASTVEPEVSARLAELVAERGAAMLDIPVSGSLDKAAAGELTLMVGGSAAVLERVRPVLEVLGNSVLHVGERNGSGLVIKLAVNMQVAAQAVAWGEGLALAAEYGIGRKTATQVMLHSVIASPMLTYRAPFVLAPPDEVWATAAQLRKDVAYAVERSAGSARAAAHALELLDDICRSGRGDREAAELIVQAASPQVREAPAP